MMPGNRQAAIPSWAHVVPMGMIIAGYLAGMFIDVMEVDAAQYASMSREMLTHPNPLHLFNRNVDYLDKPPLTFWLTALSFALFGVSNFTYKLPSVLFSLWAVWSTGKAASRLYHKETGFYASLILASTQAFFLMNQDVKTDMFLTAPVIFAVWKILSWLDSKKWPQLVWAGVGIGLAMLAKGPMGLVAPVFALAAHFAVRREWKNFIRPQWLILIGVIIIMLIPMSVGLYTQFDAHPEKEFARDFHTGGEGEGVSGLRFYYWTQSFGRITGESEWDNNAPPDFFIHTFAWSFLPWSLIFLPAFVSRLIRFFKNKFRLDEAISLGGFLLPFLALSMSKFKLPHYIFVTFPFAAILLASWLTEKEKLTVGWKAVQYFISAIGMTALLLLFFFIFPGMDGWKWMLFLLFLIPLLPMMRFVGSSYLKPILISAYIWAFVNFFVNLHFYPSLLEYQAVSQAGKYVKTQEIPVDKFYTYIAAGHALDFYSESIVPMLHNPQEVAEVSRPAWIYTNPEGMEEIMFLHPDAKVEQLFRNFPVAKLTPKFLNPATRYEVVKDRYLIRLP